MSEEEYDGPVIKFFLGIGFVNGRTEWVRAPSDWADMNEHEREEFLSEQVEQWASNYIEYGATVYDSPDVAREETRLAWGDTYSDSRLEKWFD